MSSKSFLSEFSPANMRLTELTRELFRDTEPASPEEINNGIGRLLHGFLSTIAYGRDPETGYTLTEGNQGLTEAFMKGFIFRLPNQFNSVLHMTSDQHVEMKVLISDELKRLALIPNLNIPRARLALDKSGEVCVFPIPDTERAVNRSHVGKSKVCEI